MLSSTLYFLLLTTLLWVSSSALHSSEEPYFRLYETRTWSNNDSITDTIRYDDGSLARLILLRDGDDSIALPPFGCGFICPSGYDATCFFGVLMLGGANNSVVDRQLWLANRDKPIRENGTLVMTAAGGLVLRDADGTVAWSSRTTGMSVMGIKLGDFGNLLLYNDSYTVWESFDEPTDTLVPGQMLYQDARLVAGVSTQNWSSGGQYYVRMASDGFSALVQADVPLKYIHLGPGGRAGLSNPARPNVFDVSGIGLGRSYTRPCGPINVCRPRFGPAPTTYAIHNGETLVLFIGETNYSYQISPDPALRSFPFLRLGYDGRLRTFRWKNGNLSGEIYDLVSGQMDNCQYPSLCGEYGICEGGGNCSCPKAVINGSNYFKQIEGPSMGLGCSENVSLSCQSPLDRHRLVDLGSLSYFNFIDSQAADPNFRNLDVCKNACLNNCKCKASFFKYNGSISDGDCYLVDKIFSIRENPIPGDDPYKSSAFIKVQLPYLSLAPSADPGNKTVSAGSPLQTPSQPRNNTALSNAPLDAPDSQVDVPRKKNYTAAVASGSVAIGIVLFLVVLCFVFSKKNKKKKQDTTEGDEDFQEALKMPKRFTYEELSAATNDFKDQLGGGGFGTVYKGELKDGTRIAVKRLDNRGQGMKEFLAEVETIGNVNHFNLVQLIGFCADKSCQLLVYEYMSNGSLDKWIFNREKNVDLTWQTRKKIILHIAKGLAYLHEECRQRIAHLDIKPHNILLDDDFNAKVSDFGLSKLMARDQSQVQTTMRGTPGYIAPEWQQLRITLKVDVYSFGIVALEIICGRRNLDSSRSESSMHLLRLLQEKAEANHLIDIVRNCSMVDVQLHKEEFLKMIKLCAWCLQDDHTRRPRMSMVVKVMEGAAEIEPNVSYRFCHAMARSPTLSSRSPAVADDSEPPHASVLSGPR